MKVSIRTRYVSVAAAMTAVGASALLAAGSHDSKTPMMNHGGMMGMDGMMSKMSGRGGMLRTCPMMQR